MKTLSYSNCERKTSGGMPGILEQILTLRFTFNLMKGSYLAGTLTNQGSSLNQPLTIIFVRGFFFYAWF